MVPIAELRFVKWTTGAFMCLLLGRHNHRNILFVNIFEFIGIGISGIPAGILTRMLKYLIGLINLMGKLVDIRALVMSYNSCKNDSKSVSLLKG